MLPMNLASVKPECKRSTPSFILAVQTRRQFSNGSGGDSLILCFEYLLKKKRCDGYTATIMLLDVNLSILPAILERC